MCFAAWRSSTRRLLFTERKRADSFFFLRGRNVPGAFNYITPPRDYTVHVKCLMYSRCGLASSATMWITRLPDKHRARPNCSAHCRLRFVFFFKLIFDFIYFCFVISLSSVEEEYRWFVILIVQSFVVPSF
jgi:hypothetical protein